MLKLVKIKYNLKGSCYLFFHSQHYLNSLTSICNLLHKRMKQERYIFFWLSMPSTCVWPAARLIKVWGGLRSSSILFLTVITCPSVGACTHTLNTASLLPPTSATHGERHRPHVKAILFQQEVLIGPRDWGPLHVRSVLFSTACRQKKDV